MGGILAYSASSIRACAQICANPPLWRAKAMRISSYSALWQGACEIHGTIGGSAYAHEVVIKSKKKTVLLKYSDVMINQGIASDAFSFAAK